METTELNHTGEEKLAKWPQRKPAECCHGSNMCFKDSVANCVKCCREAEENEIENHPLDLATRRSE